MVISRETSEGSQPKQTESYFCRVPTTRIRIRAHTRTHTRTFGVRVLVSVRPRTSYNPHTPPPSRLTGAVLVLSPPSLDLVVLGELVVVKREVGNGGCIPRAPPTTTCKPPLRLLHTVTDHTITHRESQRLSEFRHDADQQQHILVLSLRSGQWGWRRLYLQIIGCAVCESRKVHTTHVTTLRTRHANPCTLWCGFES